MQQVTIYADGACSGNPGPAGWAAIVTWKRATTQKVGGEPHSTNNRAEINACIAGLEVLHSRCRVTLYTDSQYVIGVMSKGWKRHTNHDLLIVLDKLCKIHQVEFVHVRGHSGDPLNEEADRLARAEVERQRSLLASVGN